MCWLVSCIVFGFVSGRPFAWVLIITFGILEAFGLRHAHDADPTLTAVIRRRFSPWLSHVALGFGLVRMWEMGFPHLLIGALAGFCVWHFDPQYDYANDT
jgi:hypothetical protein